jgi:DNA-binding SARP family transcriptional activator
VAIDAGESRIDPSASVLFAAALYLAVEGARGISRRQLQALLWPGCQCDVAAHRLRQSLLKLRQCGFPVVAEGRQRIVVNVSVTTDIDALEEIHRDNLDLATLSAPIFGSFEPAFSNDFQDWFDNYRSKLVARVARMMLKEIARLRASGNWQLVDEWCQALLRHSPENEEAILAQAESLAMRGEKTAAVRCIDKYLETIDSTDNNVRIAANVLRRRIADPTPHIHSEPHRDIALIGRERELKTISELLVRTRRRSMQACRIVGDAGIGKSKLVTEASAFAALQGIACHKIGCRSSDSKRPLSAMLQLIPSLRSARGAIGCSPDTLGFLEALITHRPDKVQRSLGDDGLSDPVFSKLDIALTDILDAVSEEVTTLIVIEDCHWMDSASADVLKHLLEKLDRQRVIFLLTTRPSDESSIPEPFGDIERLELHPLDVKSSVALIQNIAATRGKSLRASHIEWCVRIADGNPYFLHELATHCIETGDQHGVPASLSSILQQRLSRLSANALRVLQACCVLENNSTLDKVEALLDLPAHELVSGINELAIARMLAPATPDASGSANNRIESIHDLLSEKALTQLAPQALAYLHRRAAIVLEEHIARTADASALWACAKHWQLAGDTPQALRLAESCAHHLLEAELPTEASDAFARATRYCATETERLRVIESQVTASYQSSDWSQVISVGHEARQLRKLLNRDLNTHDDIELMVRRAEWRTRDWEHILADSLGCLSAADASVVHRMEAGVMALMLLSWSGDSQTATGVLEKMRELAPTSPHVRVDLWLQAEMIYNTCWGSIEQAAQAGDRLVREHRQQRNVVRLLRSLCNAAVTFRAAGDFGKASEHLREALEVAERHRIELFKGQAIPLLAHMAIDRGFTSEAQDWLDLLRTLPTSSNEPMLLAEIHSIEARLSLLNGRHKRARELVLNHLLDLKTDPMPYKRVYWNALKVATDLANDGRVSREAVDALHVEHLKTRGNVFQAFAAYTLYVGLCSLDDTQLATDLLQEYLQTFRREKWPPPVHLLQALQSIASQASRSRKQRHAKTLAS